MISSRVLTAVWMGVLIAPALVRADVTAERNERGVAFEIDGKLFTQYLTRAGQSPALWPIIGPTGEPMTRAYPLGPSQEGGTTDHPHHQSLWFTHDKVNGADFWKANVSDGEGEEGPHIAHREFVTVESNGATARLVARNDWMAGERRICQDVRTVVCGTRPNGDRWIDFRITIRATDGDLTIGDTKEGTFAIRVADSMRVAAKRGGRIINSEGQMNQDTWGMPARWVDYTGPVGETAESSDSSNERTVGIAILSHPSSFRPVPRWQVRTYGLFAANPFGEADFPKLAAAKQGAVTIEQGDSLALRYRVLLHRGTTEEAGIEAAFKEFAATR